MPSSALPPGFKDQAVGTNTDWNNPIQKYWHKSWFAYGPRATEWWAKWRNLPKLLFAMKGKGEWRYEQDFGSPDDHGDISPFKIVGGDSSWYLSCIQYWCKWHVQIQWPLHFVFHYYLDDVPVYPEKAGNRRVIYIRVGARRDADRVYWFPSLFIGLQWN